MHLYRKYILGLIGLCAGMQPVLGQRTADTLLVRKLLDYYGQAEQVRNQLIFSYYEDCEGGVVTERETGFYVKEGPEVFVDYLGTEVYSDGKRKISVNHNNRIILVDTTTSKKTQSGLVGLHINELWPFISSTASDTTDGSIIIQMDFTESKIARLEWYIDKVSHKLQKVVQFYNEGGKMCLAIAFKETPALAEILKEKSVTMKAIGDQILESEALSGPYKSYTTLIF